MLKVDKSFQKSVNLKYDIKDINEIRHYIPTSSSLKILKSYVDDFTSDYSQKSTVLVGPYGKGKSHMLLILVALFSYYENDDLMKKVLQKISNTDKDTYEKLKQVRENKKKYLPLIVSNTKKDFNQSILFSLVEALKREHINDLIPDTNFSEAIKKIDLWKKEFPEVYVELKKQVKETGKFKKELSNYNIEAYNKFLMIHKSLTAGTEFNPMIDMDITVLLEAVNRKLVEKYEYSGIVIMFDEFSKYLESCDDNTITNEIKIIQDICELGNSSKEYKLFNIFVMHKKIHEYNSNLTNKVKNAFKSIEGRIEYREFYTSSKNNYELIGNVLTKTDDFIKYISENEDFKRIQDSSGKILAFNSVFSDKEIRETIIKNCYPLTPLTAYLLLKISERIGQNERTIFTFLSSKEDNALCNILKRNPDITFVDSSYVYDYFSTLIETNRNEMNMYQINLQLKTALNSISDMDQRKYLKTIALINMINDFDNISTNTECVSNALNFSEERINEIYSILEKDEIIGRKRGIITFKTRISLSVEEEIKKFISAKVHHVSITEVLNEMEKEHYLISRKYNNELKMTRFFEKKYITFDEYNALPNCEILLENNVCDGMVLYMLLDEDNFNHKIEVDDDRFIVIKLIYNKKIESLAKKYVAIKSLLKSNADEIVKNELLNINNENIDEIENLVKISIFNETKYRAVIYSNNLFEDITIKDFEEKLYASLMSNYPCTPIINYELINKKNVTGAYKKSREIVVNGILNHEYDDYSTGTSAEASLYRATFYNTGLTNKKVDLDNNLLSIITEIKNKVLYDFNSKVSFSLIYETVESSPYGLRRGLIPLYLSYVISNLDVDITFYMENQEIDLNANLLELINTNPEQFYYLVEKKSHDREKYLQNLETIFEDYRFKRKDGISRYKRIILSMQSWLNSLPKIARQSGDFTVKHKIYPFVKFRKLLNRVDINSRDMIFSDLEKLFSNDYSLVIEEIVEIKNFMDNYLINTKKELELYIKTIYEFNQSNSLGSSFKEWFNPYFADAQIITFSSKANSFVNVIKKIESLSTNQLLDKISMSLVGMYIEDFNEILIEEFKNGLTQTKTEIEAVHRMDHSGEFRLIIKKGEENILEKIFNKHQDGMMEFMANELESILEQYGDSVDTESKIAMLVNLIQKVSEN